MEAAVEGGRTRTETNRWLVLVLVCIAQFMVILDATIVNVALPSIQHGLHFSASSLQWVVNVYTLVFGGFLLLGGRASDLLGRQRLFMAGVVVFTGAPRCSTASRRRRGCSSPAARCRDSARRSSRRPHFRSSRRPSPKAPSARRRSASGARSPPAAAPSASCSAALLTETLSWRWVFFINLPIGIAAALLSLALHRRTRGRRTSPTRRTSPAP